MGTLGGKHFHGQWNLWHKISAQGSPVVSHYWWLASFIENCCAKLFPHMNAGFPPPKKSFNATHISILIKYELVVTIPNSTGFRIHRIYPLQKNKSVSKVLPNFYFLQILLYLVVLIFLFWSKFRPTEKLQDLDSHIAFALSFSVPVYIYEHSYCIRVYI